MKSHIKNPKKGDEIWFLEHEKVYTLGTAANKDHLLSTKDIPVIESDRGGEVTYHGPGQLVIYFLLDIKKYNLGPKTLVKNIQSFIQDILSDYGIQSHLIQDAPGVYVDNKKIASIGLRITNKGKTYHGISLNIDMDLEPFSWINPCGYEGLEVTQIKNFKKNITRKAVEELAIEKLKHIF